MLVSNEKFAIAARQYKKERAYWDSQLIGRPTASHLPYEKSFEANRVEILPVYYFDEELSEVLRKMSKGSDAKLHVILTTVILQLHHFYSLSSAESVGIPIYKQSSSGELITNALMIRSELAKEDTFRTFLHQTNRRVAEAVKNQNYPISYRADLLATQAGEPLTPLFDTVVALIQVHDLAIARSIASNILFAFDAGKERLSVSVHFNVSLFSKQIVHQFLSYFKSILSKIVECPDGLIGDLSILDSASYSVIRNFGRGELNGSLATTVHGEFDQIATINPDSIALVYGTVRLSYREVKHQSDCIAGYLQSQGVHVGDIIGLIMDPGVSMWVSILGILKSGCAYLPLDPHIPSGRLQLILKDSCAKKIIVDSDVIISVPGVTVYSNILFDSLYNEVAPVISTIVTELDLCYVIYTSGSTGTPKGVMITHGNILNYSSWFSKRFGINSNDSSVLTSSYSFDLGYSSVYPLVLSGGTVHFLVRDQYVQTGLLLDYIQTSGITYLKMTPTLFSTLIGDESFRQFDLSSLRLLLLGGESIRLDEVKMFQTYHGHLEVVNHYGPTETTVGVITDTIESEESLYALRTVIGRPIYNTEVLIVDTQLRVQPLGIPGEICIGGKSVGRGYLNAPEQTARQFLFHNDSGIIYRTGDRGRMLADGRIEYLGRTDHQFKIRGYRVDLREIEQGLLTHPAVAKAVVLPRSHEGVLHLCGFVVLHLEKTLSMEGLRAHALEFLPSYMIPVELQQVVSIPMKQNGKIDTDLLLHKQMIQDAAVVVGKTETILCDIWKQVLGLQHVGVDDNFFTIGGDSIKAIQVMARMHRAGYKSDLNNIFKFPSIRQLAHTVVQKQTHAEQSLVTGEVPLLPIQRGFFELSDDPSFYNQSLLLKSKDPLDKSALLATVNQLQLHHDVLRSTFINKSGEWIQQQGGDLTVSLMVRDIRGASGNAFENVVSEVNSSINLEAGPLFKSALILTDTGDRLLMVIHHLVVDGVSWRIILEDLENGYQQYLLKKSIVFPEKSDSFQRWTRALEIYSSGGKLKSEIPYWINLLSAKESKVSFLNGSCPSDVKDFYIEKVTSSLTMDETKQLIGEAHKAYTTSIDDLLMTALSFSYHAVMSETNLLVEIEGHGRESIVNDVDVSRTVGWFTSRYPVALTFYKGKDVSWNIKETKEMLRKIPSKGIGYGILRYMSTEQLIPAREVRIGFNYLGQFESNQSGTYFSVANESSGRGHLREQNNRYALNYIGIVTENKLTVSLAYNKNFVNDQNARALIDAYFASLRDIINHCTSLNKSEITPSDLTYKGLSLDELDTIFK